MSASGDADRMQRRTEQMLKLLTEQYENKEQLWYESNSKLRAHVKRLADENLALKTQGSRGFFSRSKKKTEAEHMDDTMRIAQEHADLLRAVVLPMEAEIDDLRRRLRVAQGPRVGCCCFPVGSQNTLGFKALLFLSSVLPRSISISLLSKCIPPAIHPQPLYPPRFLSSLNLKVLFASCVFPACTAI